jgi:hypothetical protein
MLPILLALLLAEPARVAKAREASEPQIRKLFAGLDYPPRRELYVIAADARAAGARLLVEIFPGRNWDGLLKKAEGRPALRSFWENLREGDAIFLERREPPVDKRGRYSFR